MKNVTKLLLVARRMSKNQIRKKQPVASKEPVWHAAQRRGYRDSVQTRQDEEVGTVANLDIVWKRSKKKYFLVFKSTTYTGGKYKEGRCFSNDPTYFNEEVLISKRNLAKIERLLKPFWPNEVENTLDLLLGN